MISLVEDLASENVYVNEVAVSALKGRKGNSEFFFFTFLQNEIPSAFYALNFKRNKFGSGYNAKGCFLVACFTPFLLCHAACLVSFKT